MSPLKLPLLPRWDSLPNVNVPLFSPNPRGFQFLSWNGRGICVADSIERARLGRTVFQLSQKMQVLCFQEVHGLEAEILLSFQGWLPGWHISVSVPRSDDGMETACAGGVVTAVCPSIASFALFEDEVLIPGRCIGTSILAGDKVLTVLNLHNHGLKAEQVRRIGNFTSLIIHNIRDSPCSKFGILLGDLNIKAEEELVFNVGRNFEHPNVRYSGNPVYSGTHLRIWESILDEWTEVIQPFPTHFNSRENSCSRIDRGWVACPSSLLTKMLNSSYVISSPEAFHASGLSDHAPMVIAFAAVPRQGFGDPPPNSSPNISRTSHCMLNH